MTNTVALQGRTTRGGPINREAIADHLASLQSFFTEHFDRGWLTMQLDDLPIDRVAYRHVRNTLAITSIYPSDMPGVVACVEALFRFIDDLRRYLLPELRDRLGVSGLTRQRRKLDPVTRVQHELLASVFPHNLAELERRTVGLRNAISNYSQ
ncbi:MAG: hypothetical protein ACLFNT_07990 [Spirochaetales bacterium]